MISRLCFQQFCPVLYFHWQQIVIALIKVKHDSIIPWQFDVTKVWPFSCPLQIIILIKACNGIKEAHVEWSICLYCTKHQQSTGMLRDHLSLSRLNFSSEWFEKMLLHTSLLRNCLLVDSAQTSTSSPWSEGKSTDIVQHIHSFFLVSWAVKLYIFVQCLTLSRWCLPQNSWKVH